MVPMVGSKVVVQTLSVHVYLGLVMHGILTHYGYCGHSKHCKLSHWYPFASFILPLLPPTLPLLLMNSFKIIKHPLISIRQVSHVKDNR